MLDQDLERQILAGFDGLTLESQPWDHAECPNFLDRDNARLLASAFDQTDMKRYEKDQIDKPYKFSNALLENEYPEIRENWQRMANFLQGETYCAALERLTGQGLNGRRRTLNMWSYAPGDLLGPHLDHPEKIVTQIFYLSEDWTTREGGRLAILLNNSIESAIRHVPAEFGSSFIFLRSEKSWHAVEPIAPNSNDRRSMTLTYWDDTLTT